MDAVVVRSLVIASSVACCIVLVSNKIRDRERKKKEDEFIPASPYVELYLLNRQRLLEYLNAAQLAYDPLDPQLDPTLVRRPCNEAYMELCNDAITYFKTVQEKAPNIFDGGSWLTEVKDCLPQKYLKDSKVDLNKEGMEGYRAMMRARIAQSAEMRARFAQSAMDDDNEMWDDDDDEIGGEQEGEYA